MQCIYMYIMYIMYIYMCIYMCIYIRTHMYIYIHIYIYTYKFITLCRTVFPLCMAIVLTIFGEICMVLHNNT